MKSRQQPPEYIRLRRIVIRESMADRILEALCDSHQGLTRTEISALFNRYRPAREIAQVLVLLHARGLIRFEMQKTKGRSVERWFSTWERATAR